MKKVLMTAILVLAFAPGARAAGYGGYFEYARAFDSKFTSNSLGDLSYDEDHYGLGFCFDTNVAQDLLFNYRLSVGYQHVEGDYSGLKQDGDGFNIDNAFGFGIVRNNNVRVWIGPGVRLGFDFFNDSYDFAIGAGPEIGVNFLNASQVSIGLTAGYQIAYNINVPDNSHFDDVDGYEQIAFAKLVVLFRTGDDLF
jgi:hypothetical protein